jgi:hypothetical protein
MDWVDSIKAESGCDRCGSRDPRVLEFHHRNPSAKEATVGDLIRWCRREEIRAEIAKCDVLCANCHRIKHWEEHNLN